MKYSNDDFKCLPSYEKTIGTPIFLPMVMKKYESVLEDAIYYANEDFGTACALISQLKHRAWTMPDLEIIKGGVVDRNNFSLWQKKNGRDENKIDTFIDYAMALPQEKIKEMWTANKLKQPVSVCCIAFANAEIKDGYKAPNGVVSAINSVLKNSKLGNIADISVGDEIMPSIDLYNALDRYERIGYEKFKSDFDIHNSDYVRSTYSTLHRDTFMCIPVYVRSKIPGIVYSDTFFSTRSDITKFDTGKIEKELSKNSLGSVAWEYCFPAEAIPEVGRLIKLKNDDLSSIKNNIKTLCNDLSQMKGNLYIDLRIRGSQENGYAIDRVSDEDEDDEFYGNLARAMYEALYDGGGYLCIINDVPDSGITACGLAFDCIERWKDIPADFLMSTYKMPYLTNRTFSKFNVKYVEFKDVFHSEYEIY